VPDVEPDLIDEAPWVRFLGAPLEVHESLDSTNDEVFRRALGGAPEGLVVAAGHQTSGKGRLGRTWLDKPGRSLMFSILLKPPIPLQSYPLLSLGLAWSAAWTARGRLARSMEYDRHLAGEVALKWPNDVLHRGRKLCGVLAESRVLRPGESPALVLGVGMNVDYREEDFPEEIRARATSLSIATGEDHIKLSWVYKTMLNWFDQVLRIAYEGELGFLLTVLQGELPEPGSRVRIALADRAVEAELLELTETGALRVRDEATGATEILTAGVME
jgi:BirA family transcriptional regulator, biotin operon repressor / biotin---[acetyl-CoA-carboxylase] ligase